MKKVIITTAIALFLGMNLSAQSDSFFTYRNVEESRTETNWGTMPTLPASHGLDVDHGANAPLGSGLLILGGLAVAYTRKKKNRN